ncbi:hypothetical protein ACOMHN_010479 [Nucella lapillus]
MKAMKTATKEPHLARNRSGTAGMVPYLRSDQLTASLEYSGCGGDLTTPTGSFISPNYPNPYTHNSECFWTIRGAQGSSLQLTFQDLDVETHSQCRFDYLEVRENGPTGYQIGDRVCGTTIPSPVNTTASRMWIKYHADSSVNGRGFSATYNINCRNRLTAHSGVIESINYPDTYPNNQNCSWLIAATAGNTVNISFETFPLESGSGCPHDYLEILDGESPSSPSLGKFCDDNVPTPVTSTSNRVRVNFVTDSSVTYGGFRLHYVTNGCGGMLSGPSGNFTSPNYPNPYQDATTCEWTITVNTSYAISLTFHDFDIENHQNCRYDAVEVYAGRDDRGPQLTKLCHSQTTAQVTQSTGNVIFVRMRTDSSISGRGFSASWTQIPGGCGGTYSTRNGIIMSKNYPSNYPHNTECEWLISLPVNRLIIFNITDFDIEGGSCGNDYLDLYDGPNTNSRRMAHLCGREIPGNSTYRASNNMYVKMRTDSSVTGRGFKAQYYPGYQEVEENTNLTFTCDEYYGGATWLFRAVTGGTTSIGTCTSTCESTIHGFTLTANRTTSSSLTTSRTARDSLQSGAEYQCVHQGSTRDSIMTKCGLHVIVPAVVSQPTPPVINKQDSGYILPIYAAITRIYSSRGLYSCAGQLGSSSQPGTLVLSPTASDTSNTADRSGRCDVTMSIPVTSGTYPCNVTVNPGNTQTPCGSFTITRPSPPTISCPSGFIPENTPLTCTCNTSNIGQPGGRLRWYTGTGSNFSTEVVSANYDVTTLEMTRTVTRGDHGRKFGCVNNWTVKVNAASDYTVSVGYRASDTKLTINGKTTITVSEKETVALTCQSRGRPAPELKLLQRDVELARYNGGQLSLSEERSQLSHNTAARCDNTGIITCRASNGVGSAQDISVQLYVNCKPRSIQAVPVPPKVNFINKPVTAAFDLEAFPLPDNVTFQYLGRTQNSSGSQPVPASIELRAECSNTYADFAVRCNVSVDKANDSTAEGFYTFTAANDFGEEQFVFKVTLNDHPTDSSSGTGATVGEVTLGVTLAVVGVIVVAIVLVVIVLWRRHWVLPCADEGGRGHRNRDSRPPDEDSREEPQSVRPVSDVYEMTDLGSPRHHTGNEPSSVYSSLETRDIGVPSVYSHITPCGNVGAAADLPHKMSPVYENIEVDKTAVYVNVRNNP